MNQNFFYEYIQKQVVLLMILSLVQGFAYTLLCWMNDIILPAIIWYALINIACMWGWSLYRRLHIGYMSFDEHEDWYQEVRLFMYVIFGLWTVLFILYVEESESNLHYVAIFTQLGMSIVASTFLVSDKKLFVPILLILMYPLVIYFTLIGEWYSYFLSIFSAVFLGILLYSSNKSYELIQQVFYEAQHDTLTGLYNRRFFVTYLDTLLNTLQRTKQFGYVLLIDLDYFKTINDSLGHKVGDNLLIEVGKRIENFCADTHTMARLGGDEFVIASDEFDNAEECMKAAYAFAEELRIALKNTYLIDHHTLYISSSIGISSIGNSKLSANEVIKEADIAMYAVKDSERDGIILFNEELKKHVDLKLQMERRLHFSLKNNEIELNYQSQVNSESEVIGCEVLVRWNNSKLGNVAPEEFIAIAEKTGFIIELGSYILEESFKTLRRWDNNGIELEQYSINISVKQFFHISFVEEVRHLCEKYLNNYTRSKVVFEVTETLFAEDIDRIVRIMDKLRDLNISLSMDDFGTGYSSLSSLRDLPIDELKIDQTFVKHIGENSSDEMMIITILTMAKIFDLKTVAEGVETEEQFNFLLKNGCDIFQGYYFSKPLNLEDFEREITKNMSV
jgi:diguanylate cyclase (GGDEF)-like protein